jgi:hypothetical protein
LRKEIIMVNGIVSHTTNPSNNRVKNNLPSLTILPIDRTWWPSPELGDKNGRLKKFEGRGGLAWIKGREKFWAYLMQTTPLGTFRHGFGDDYWWFEGFEDDGGVVRERTDWVLREEGKILCCFWEKGSGIV